MLIALQVFVSVGVVAALVVLVDSVVEFVTSPKSERDNDHLRVAVICFLFATAAALGVFTG